MQKATVLAAALLALSVSARADLKVTQTTKIDNPQLKAYLETMTPQQRAQMTHGGGMMAGLGPTQTTVYFHGAKTRADVGPMTFLYDAATHQTITLNRTSHTYTARPAPPSGAGQFQVTVKPTGQSKTIQGHVARHYLMSATNPTLPGTIIQGDIWAASDLPTPPSLTGGGPFAIMQALLRKVHGYPLIANVVATGSPMGNTTVQTRVMSVSQAPLPASVFAIPTGYAKSNMGAGGSGGD